MNTNSIPSGPDEAGALCGGDRELLERAAKAAGLEVHRGNLSYQRDMLFCSVVDVHGIATGVQWNPLTHDGDALRLAVKLGLEFRQIHFKAHAGYADRFWETEHYGADPYAATRRAIVRAAAALAPLQTEKEPEA